MNAAPEKNRMPEKRSTASQCGAEDSALRRGADEFVRPEGEDGFARRGGEADPVPSGGADDSALRRGGGELKLSVPAAGREPSLPAWVELEPSEEAAGGNGRKGVAEPKEFQFSLLELLGLVIAASLLWSVVVSVSGPSAPLCAGLLGLVVLAGLIVLELRKITRPILRVAWWVALAFYLMACVVAIIRG